MDCHEMIIMRYRAHLVALEFSQISKIDFNETYSLVIDTIILTFYWIDQREKSWNVFNL